MKVDVSEIFSNENKEMSREVEIDFTSFDAGVGEFPVLKKAPFLLSIANVGNKQLKITGNTEVTVGIPCDRCLTQVPTVFPVAVSKEDRKSVV